MVFVITFFSCQYIFPELEKQEFGFVGKVIRVFVLKYGSLLYALSGSVFAWLVANKYLDKGGIVSPYVFKLNSLCFGIYLFQQFILQILYYKTDLPQLVGPYFLPWIACTITLVTSYLLSVMCLKNKIGRFLIG